MAVPDKDYVVGKMRDIYGDLQYIMLGAWCDWLDGSEYGRNRYNRENILTTPCPASTVQPFRTVLSFREGSPKDPARTCRPLFTPQPS